MSNTDKLPFVRKLTNCFMLCWMSIVCGQDSPRTPFDLSMSHEKLLFDLPALVAVALDELVPAFAVQLQAGFLQRPLHFLLHEFLPNLFPIAQRLLFLRREIRPTPEILLEPLALLGRQRIKRLAD